MRSLGPPSHALSASTLCAAALLFATTASAQAPDGAGGEAMPWAMSQQNRAGAEVDFWSAKQSQTFGFGPASASLDVSWYALGFDAVGQFRLVPHVFLDLDVPFGYANYSITQTVAGREQSSSLDHFVLGNITVGAHYAQDATREVAFFVGGTVSIPTMLAHEPDFTDTSDVKTFIASALLGDSRAFYDIHRYAPEYVPIRVHGGVEWRIVPIVYFRADIAPAFYIPLHSNDAEFFTDQGNEIEVRAQMGVGGGLRLQESFFWTKLGSCPAGQPDCPASDMVQTAIEPFFTYEPPGAGLYARFGLLVALDKQAGFGFDHGKVATLRGGIGGKW